MMEGKFDQAQLIAFYQEKLGGISSQAELQKALTSGALDLGLDPDDFIPAEKREEIKRDNPDEVMIGGKQYSIEYKYTAAWYGEKEKFSAAVKIELADIIHLSEVPTLPSGRELTIDASDKDGGWYFSGTDLADVKERSREYLVKKQWKEWEYSDDKPKKVRLEDFDLLGDLPELPEPIEYGTDPISGEPIYSYPAVIVDTGYGDKYYIAYYSSQAEAQEAQGKVVAKMEAAVKAREVEEEKARLAGPAKELLEEVRPRWKKIDADYRRYGLTYSEYNRLKSDIHRAENLLDEEFRDYNPTQAIELLNKVRDTIGEKEKIVAEREGLLPGVSEARDRLKAKVGLIARSSKQYGFSDDDFSELYDQWQEAGKLVDREGGDLRRAGELLSAISDRLENVNTEGWDTEAAQRYLEDKDSRYGEKVIINIKGGQVFSLAGEKLKRIGIGTSRQHYQVSPSGHGVQFRYVYASGNSDDHTFKLEDGTYSIFRDGQQIFRVEVDGDGKVIRVVEQVERDYEYDDSGTTSYYDESVTASDEGEGSGLGAMADAFKGLSLGNLPDASARREKQTEPVKLAGTPGPKVEVISRRRVSRPEPEPDLGLEPASGDVSAEEVKPTIEDLTLGERVELQRSVEEVQQRIELLRRLNPRPKNSKASNFKELDKIWTASGGLLSDLGTIEKSLTNTEMYIDRVRGQIQGVGARLDKLYVRLGKLQGGEVVSLSAAWQEVPGVVDKNGDAQEFITEKMATRDQIISATRKLLITKKRDMADGGINLEEVLEEVLAEF
ncbi:MAG: hypothetical protein ABII72_03935 [Parcubacteria group bacterium]